MDITNRIEVDHPDICHARITVVTVVDGYEHRFVFAKALKLTIQDYLDGNITREQLWEAIKEEQGAWREGVA
jgi:hypothetical protein